MIVRELLNKIGFRVDEAGLRRTEQRVKAVARNMENVGKRLSLAVTLPILGLGVGLLKTASDVEQLEVAFTTMLGSAELAKKTITELYNFAATTPFEIKDIGPVAKQLLAVGIEQEDLIDTLTNLGNVAAGLSVPLSRLVLNYGQVKTQAKLTGRELRDFAIAGVPLTAELARSLGVADKAIAGMVSRGEIGFKEVQKAFKNMASDGGRFANLMAKQAKTLGGLWSNFLDVLFITASKMGTVLVEVTGLKKGLDSLVNGLSKVTVWFESLSKTEQRFIFIMAGVLAAIGPMLFLFSKLSLIGMGVVKMLGLITFGYARAGTAALIMQAKMALIPIAIAAAIALLALFIEDLSVWAQGGDSLIGALIGPFDEYRDRVMSIMDKFREVFRLVWEIALPNSVKAGIALATAALFSFREKGKPKASFKKRATHGVLQAAGFDVQRITKIADKIMAVNKAVFDKVADIDLPFLDPIQLDQPSILFGGAGGGTTTTKQINIRSDIKMEIPAGTTDDQKIFIETQARRVVSEENDKMARAVEINNPEVEE